MIRLYRTLSLIMFFSAYSLNVWAGDFYFKAKDSNWNNPNNWVDENSVELNKLPSNEDNVFIDGDFLINNHLSLNSNISLNSIIIRNLKNPFYFNSNFEIKVNNNFKANEFLRTSGTGKIIFSESEAKIKCKSTLNWSLFIKNSSLEIEEMLTMGENTTFEAFNSSLNFRNSASLFNFYLEKISKNQFFMNQEMFLFVRNNINLNKTSDKLLDEYPIIVKSGGQKTVNTCGSGANEYTIETTVTSNYNGAEISCNGGNDGEICVAVTSGGSGNFSFNWLGAAGPSTPCWSGVSAGTYTVIVTDNVSGVNCGTTISISEPGEITTINFSYTEPTCNGACDGTGSHSPFGGTGALSFLWSPNGSTVQNPTDLCAGVNQLTISDVNGCTFDTTFTLTEPDAVTINPTANDVLCNGDCTGEITTSVSGGTGNLTFQWFDCNTSNAIPGETNQDIFNLCPGSYYLEVTDDNACVFNNQASCETINEPPVLGGSLSNIIDASCAGVCNGEATVSPTGGVAPYTVDWIDVGTGLSVGNGTSINTLCAGDYFAQITDDNNCVFTTANFTINNGITVSANASSNDVSCFGVCDGTASSSPSGGTAPYSFQWETVPGGAVVGGSANINGLCPGDYEVTITDNNGCISAPVVVTVDEPTQITVTLNGTHNTCFQSCDGTVNAVPAGGVAPYTYNWTPNPTTGQGTPNISDLCAGNYEVVVTDDNNCQVTDNFTVNEPPQYDIDAVSTDIVCNGDCDGTASVTVNNGGTPGYTYTWSPAPPTGQGTPNASGLCSGNISVLIEDTQGCDTTISFNITEPPVLQVNAVVLSHVTCSGGCNGSAQVNVVGGNGPYNISWNDPGSQSGAVASGLCAGNYIVTVQDANNCVETANVTINEPNPFDLTVSSTDVDCFGDCDGTGSVTVNSGGTPAYTINWNDPLNQTNFNATSLCAGSYNVVVEDQNGCDTAFTVTINEPTQLTQTTLSNNAACAGACDGDAEVIPGGGTPPYTIDWFNTDSGVNIGNGTTISNLCAGNYQAVITDDNGCVINSDPITITEQDPIVVTTTLINDAGCNMCNGEASASASGGSGNFVSFNWTPGGQTGQVVNTLCGGVNTVTVTDDNGCEGVATVGIINVAAETINMTSNDASCFGVCDGDATANFTCLDNPCNVEWFDASTGNSIGQTTVTATNLCAGNYYVELTNGSGCIRVEPVTINEPNEIITSISSTDVNCNGACDGTASVSASGGAGGFTYNWAPLPGSGQGTPNAGGLCPGAYSVTVTDVDGCDDVLNVNISEPTPLNGGNVSSTDVSCNGGNDGTVSVIPNNGTPPYTYQWFDCFTNNPMPGMTSQVENNVAPGDYFVQITDNNNCIVNSPCVTVDEPDVLNATFNITNVTCNGDCNGSITATPSGGVSNYSFQWLDNAQNPIPGQTNNTITNLCPDTYFFQVSDLNGCTEIIGPVNIVEPNPWNVTSSQSDETCFNACNGLAGVVVNSGNTPPYTYSWNDPGNQTNPTATGLCAGNYDVVISDNAGCDTTVSFVINAAAELFANVNITPESCFGSCDASLTANPSGGDGNYTFSWTPGGATTPTISNLCDGSYDLNITDGNGCFIDTTIVINPQSEIIANVVTNDASCGNCNGSAIASPTGGTGSYTFNWTPAPGAGQGTNNATSLCAGIYSVQITDNSGCSINENVNISDANAENLSTSTVDASCFGVCDGEATVSFVCSDPPCTQTWYDNSGAPIGQTGLTASGLCAGDYTVEVINNTGCIALETVTINEPTQIDDNENITDVTCNGASDGQIEVNPTGGSGAGYTYNWVPAPGGGQGTNIATGLNAGTWDVTITDGNGCNETFQYTLNDPSTLSVNFTSTNNGCSGNCDGSITLTVNGGVPPYSYQWLDGGGAPIPGETADNIQNLCSGNYNVQVTDQTGCVFTFSNPISISQPSTINAPIGGVDILCNGNCSGEAFVDVTGGVAPYTVDWYDAATNNLIGQTGDTAYSLCPGDYYAIITDDNGCTFNSADVTINEPTAITDNLTSNDAGCFGTCDGSASVAPSGGTAPYTYNWQDALGNPLPGGNNSSVSNLCPGNYQVTITDDNGCTVGPLAFTINNNPQITGNITSNDATCGVNNGTANIVAAGGTAPYTYQWLDEFFNPIPGETNPLIQNLPAGIYYVVVTDDNGCTEQFQAIVNNPNTTNVVIDNINDASCFGACDGSIDITASPDNPPLSFVWNPGGISVEDPTNLCAGDYTLEVTDGLGCVNYYNATVGEASEIQATFTQTDATCGACDGELVVNATGGTGNLNFNWSNGGNGTTVSNLCAGVYDVLITDDNGCTNTISSSISNTDGPDDEDVVVVPSNCNGDCNGEITVNALGGTPPYTYLWVHDGSTSNNVTGLCAGTYFVQMMDDNGCVRTVEIEVPEQNPIDVVDNMNPPTCGNNDGSITIVSSGGSLPHTYLWNTSDVTPAVNNLGAGLYSVTVTDDNGCTADFDFTLNDFNAPQIVVDETDILCFGDADGELNANITGGTAPYNIEWLDNTGTPIGQNNPLATGLSEGSYFIEVTDDNGCISTSQGDVDAPDTLELSFPITQDVLCAGDCSGIANVIVTGGTLPYTYAWDDPASQTTPNATGLCEGSYEVTVTDDNGCIVTQDAVVNEPDTLDLVFDNIISANCVNTNEGEIEITISGGEAPYNISWTSDDPSFSSSDEDLTNLAPGEYYIEVIDDNGCVVLDTAQIDPGDDLTAIAPEDTLLCFGDEYELIGAVLGTGITSTEWTDSTGALISDSTHVLINPQPGLHMYVFTVSNGNCTHSDTVMITVGSPVSADAGPDVEVLEGLSVQIGGDPTGSPGNTIVWTPSDYLTDVTAPNPYAQEVEFSTTYIITSTDTNGCVATDTMEVLIIPDIVFPNGFSPNDDGTNDLWEITFAIDFPEMEVEVYNRWGELLFYSSGAYSPWDGKFNGEPVPVGTYYYIINLNHPEYPDPYTGPLTIMR